MGEDTSAVEEARHLHDAWMKGDWDNLPQQWLKNHGGTLQYISDACKAQQPFFQGALSELRGLSDPISVQLRAGLLDELENWKNCTSSLGRRAAKIHDFVAQQCDDDQ